MSKFYKSAFIFGSFASAILVSGTAIAANDIIGVNSAVKGDVTIQTGEQAAKQAVIAKPVALGDVINSNRVGSLQVLLKDQTIFTVGPDCVLTIDKFVYDPNKNTNSMKAKVQKGMFRFMSGNISKSGPSSISIDSPVASMGVRGTIVEGLVGAEAVEFALNAGAITRNTKVDRQGATLFVLRGPGRKHLSKNRKGEISITSAGQTVIVRQSGLAVFVADKDTPPSQPFALRARDFQTFSDRLRTKPESGVSYKPFAIDSDFRRAPKRTNAVADTPVQNDYFDPEADLDRPTEFDSQFNQPEICTPLNPNFPNC